MDFVMMELQDDNTSRAVDVREFHCADEAAGLREEWVASVAVQRDVKPSRLFSIPDRRGWPFTVVVVPSSDRRKK